MADKKISALTAKNSNLESTDVFAIAEDDGAGGFVSKGITGDEIKSAITKVGKNSLSSNSYTLVLTDRDKLLEVGNSTDITITLPTNASVAFPIGTQILLVQSGIGQCIFTPSVGVNLYAEDSKVKTVGQYAMATLIKCDTDSWYLGGNLEQI
ncbi:hypothetical protein [uncultured Mediterranean phage uvMED]|nr:hypothetical protein [uncultured Mediterranean phage uvMED]